MADLEVQPFGLTRAQSAAVIRGSAIDNQPQLMMTSDRIGPVVPDLTGEEANRLERTNSLVELAIRDGVPYPQRPAINNVPPYLNMGAIGPYRPSMPVYTYYSYKCYFPYRNYRGYTLVNILKLSKYYLRVYSRRMLIGTTAITTFRPYTKDQCFQLNSGTRMFLEG
uniref:Gag-pro-like protein n=1 Tax=Meloidogyne hapla TaxID=6305 RepID=A0A1I8BM59_MELHA